MSSEAVALMYYGFPERREEMYDYLKNILHGKEPSERLIQENLGKLDLIGGESPSTKIVKNIRNMVEERFEKVDISVYLFAKHYKPYLSTANESIKERKIYEVPLFPVYSRYIFDSYFTPFESQFPQGSTTRITDIGFYPGLVNFFKDGIQKDEKSVLTFSAHSIPLTGIEDPYANQIQRLSSLIADGKEYINIYHSQSRYHPKWLTPNPEFAVNYAVENGFEKIAVVPVGFIYEHIEVLYDLDIQLKDTACERGIQYSRIPLPNDSDQVINAIVSAVEKSRF